MYINTGTSAVANEASRGERERQREVRHAEFSQVGTDGVETRSQPLLVNFRRRLTASNRMLKKSSPQPSDYLISLSFGGLI
jgi:hypothetical protein